jgi:hypothetical protein
MLHKFGVGRTRSLPSRNGPHPPSPHRCRKACIRRVSASYPMPVPRLQVAYDGDLLFEPPGAPRSPQPSFGSVSDRFALDIIVRLNQLYEQQS